MASLNDQLYDSRIQSADSRYFIPETALDKVLTHDAIRRCIETADIEVFRQQDIVHAVIYGGRRVLAVLILLAREASIVSFVESDQLVKGRSMDSQLPLEREPLQNILTQGRLAAQFYERQWEVLAPFFQDGRTHRLFHKNTILPFIESEELAEGGYGQVIKVVLDERHHGFAAMPGKKVSLVRKIIKPIEPSDEEEKQNYRDNESQKDSDAFRSEERILSLLRSLKHPNIVQLLASFSVQQYRSQPSSYIHSLLFPLADESLSSLLRTKQLDVFRTHFKTDYALYQQLFGLSSAIEMVHNYFSEEYKLQLIGCHYDLNPRNILVSKGGLLLADFGLSRLRPDCSRSLFREGRGDYLAPECEVVENGTFVKGLVGRAGDIWSFGCVLSEVLIFLRWQSEGVKRFRESRKAVIFEHWTASQFHAFGKVHPAVHGLMKTLKKEVSIAQQGILDLINVMLHIDADQRPKADEITRRLYLIAQESFCSSILDILKEIKPPREHLELKIERERFSLWASGATLTEDLDTSLDPVDRTLRSWLSRSREHYDPVSLTLRAVYEEVIYIRASVEEDASFLHPIYLPLHELNDKLWLFAPSQLRKKMTGWLEDRMLSTFDSDDLRQTKETLSGEPQYRNLALLAAMKYMTSQVEDDRLKKSRRLLLNEPVLPRKSLGHGHLGSFIDGHSQEIQVLIEWMEYNESWTQRSTREELYDRVQNIAELYGSLETPSRLRILRCVGYFHELSRHAFGLVYELPKELQKDAGPKTLKQMMRETRRPLLGSLFDLALAILECVLNFHKIGWLHKSVSAYNVIVFCPPPPTGEAVPTSNEISPRTPNSVGTQDRNEIEGNREHKRSLFSRSSKKDSTARHASRKMEQTLPVQPSDGPPILKPPPPAMPGSLYVVGFNHSRPDKDIAFTQGPSTDPRQVPYQHPEYTLRRFGFRFQPVFEYYSVGLLLLEIGLWTPLSDLVPGGLSAYSPKEQQKLWVEEYVPRLGETMGEIYRDAVGWCLRGGIDGVEDRTIRDLGEGQAPGGFEAMVVSQIRRCYV